MPNLSRDTQRLIMEYLRDICLRSSNFDNVLMHEPKSEPTGLDCSIWMQTLQPAASGLNSTSVRAEFAIRVEQNMLYEPQDAIDSGLSAIAWDVIADISNDFTLGGLVKSVSLTGEDGNPLSSEAGYIQHGQTLYRCIVITVPALINDAFEQVRTA